MEDTPSNDALSRRALSSFTTSVGLALGELLLLTGRPEELLEHLRDIHVSARAAIMVSEAGGREVVTRRAGVSLAVAALRAVQAWNAEPQDPAAVDDALALLAEVLEEMGLLRMAGPADDKT